MFPSINTNQKPSTPRAVVSAGGLSTTSTTATAVSAATAARQQRIQAATNSGRFEAWHKAEEPLWERRSPRFFNAQKYVRDNPYPRLYRGSSTTGAQAPMSRRDEEERHIRPPTVSCTTPRRAVQTLLGERGERDLIHRILPRDNNQQNIHLLSASSPPKQIQQQQQQRQHLQAGRKLSSPPSSGSNNSSGVLPQPHVPRGVVPASSSSTNSGTNTRRPSALQTANFDNTKSQQRNPANQNNNNNIHIKRKNANKNDCDSSEEDDAFDDPEYYSHQHNKKNRESLFEMLDEKQPSPSSKNKKKSDTKNNNTGANGWNNINDDDDDDDDDDDEDEDEQQEDLDNSFSRNSPDEGNANRRGHHPSDDKSSKAQQQSAINRRAFELLRRLFILQVGERSVTRAFLDKLPGVEVVERIEQVLGRVGASRFMSLDDFHLVLNQALCPSSGAANSALPSASEAIGGSLMSPRSGLRNKQKRTESFTEKQRKLNVVTNTASPLNSQASQPPPTLMISGVPTLETASAGGSPVVLQLQQSRLKITNNSTKNQLGSADQSNLQAPSLDATMNQTMNSLAVTYGANYRMTANQDKIHQENISSIEKDPKTPATDALTAAKKSPVVIPVNNAQNRGVFFGFVPPPPLLPAGSGSSSGIPMGFVDEDTSHITTTESRILFSLFESNGLVSIHQIKEGFDLLLRGEQYALQAYTRKIVCEPDNSEKESTVTVLELEWMLGAVCNYFAGDAELRACSGRLIANLWREAHQGCVARRTFRLAVLDDPLLHRAVAILPRYGSADAFALRPEQNAPLVADPMKMISMTADMVQPHANSSSNNNNNNSSLSPEASVNFPSKSNNNMMRDSTANVLQNANKSGLKKIGSGVNFDPNVLAEDEKNIGRNNNNKKSSKNNNSSSAGGGGRGLAFETLDLYDPLFKGDQCLSKDPTKLTDAATKEAGDPQFFSLRGQPYITVFGGPPQPIFDVRS